MCHRKAIFEATKCRDATLGFTFATNSNHLKRHPSLGGKSVEMDVITQSK